MFIADHINSPEIKMSINCRCLYYKETVTCVTNYFNINGTKICEKYSICILKLNIYIYRLTYIIYKIYHLSYNYIINHEMKIKCSSQQMLIYIIIINMRS